MAGGAWKVAYADFVTAMMAFFLLLWLLASASEEQKDGIAEYFTPTVGIRDSAGIGFEGGESQNTTEGVAKDDTSAVQITTAQPEQGQITNNEEASMVDGDEESDLFEDAKKEIAQAIESDPNLREFSENILMEQTPEGLKIEIADDDTKSMYEPGGAKLSKSGMKVLEAMIPMIRKLPNHISVGGHTDAQPYAAADKKKRAKYSNWELSTDRAQAARRFMEGNELTKERVKKVVGYASEQLLDPDQPTAPKNRRIEIILLRGAHMSLLPQSEAAPRSLLSVPKANDTLQLREKSIAEEVE